MQLMKSRDRELCGRRFFQRARWVDTENPVPDGRRWYSPLETTAQYLRRKAEFEAREADWRLRTIGLGSDLNAIVETIALWVSPPKDDFGAIIPPKVVSMYIQAKAEYEQKRTNPLRIPKWSERPKFYCIDRCKVTTSFDNATHGTRYFSCANKDDAFTWIDGDVPKYAGGPVT
uniref:Uncharacterized protein n=1 Tax=Leersia perrieri TaxID=77586 RepID=A0A0D9WYF5_9ORYZ